MIGTEVAVVASVLESLVLACLTGSQILVGVVWHHNLVMEQNLVNWLVLTLGVVAELAEGHIVNGLVRHRLLEMDGGAVMGVTVEHSLVDDGHDSLVHERLNSLVVDHWLVVHDSLVVHDGHDVADDLVVDGLVVRDHLMHDGGVVVHWLVTGVVMHWLLVEGLLTVVVGVRALVMLHLVVRVGRLVVRMVRLVVGLVGPVRAVLWVSVPSMVIAIVVGTVMSVSVSITVVAVSVSITVVAI